MARRSTGRSPKIQQRMYVFMTKQSLLFSGLPEAFGGIHPAEQLDFCSRGSGAEKTPGETAAQVGRRGAARTDRGGAAAEGAGSA